MRSSLLSTPTSSLLLLVSTVTTFFQSIAHVHGVLVLQNARIYTLDEDNPWAESLAIDPTTGLLLAVGSQATVAAFVDAFLLDQQTNDTAPVIVVDVQDRLVLPGFHDAHIHAVEAGINMQLCLLDEDAPLDELDFYFVEDEEFCPTGGPFGDQGWVVGAGLDLSLLLDDLKDTTDPSQYPIAFMDDFFTDQPAFILDALGHGALANTLALEAVGFTQLAARENPPGGILHRDAQGALTGIVLENAQQPLRNAAFPPTAANQQLAYDSLLDTLPILARQGITTVSDAGGFWQQAQTESWKRAEDNDLLTVRARNALYTYPDVDLMEQVTALTDVVYNASRLVTFNQAKIYVDGILSLGSSALKDPYVTGFDAPPGPLGFEYFGDAATLTNVATTLASNGFQLHMHVTGDRAASLALDAINASLQSTPNVMHRLTHCYLVDPVDRPRLAELNVVADMQLSPSSLTDEYEESLLDKIGQDRVAQLLPAKELVEAGATLVLSSDWDADDLPPLGKIQTVLTRSKGRGLADVATVLPLLTRNPATLLDSNAGVLKTGKAADVIILSQNILELPVDRIGVTKVLVTIFDGKVIYDPEGIAGAPIGDAPSAGTSKDALVWVPVMLFLAVHLYFAS